MGIRSRNRLTRFSLVSVGIAALLATSGSWGAAAAEPSSASGPVLLSLDNGFKFTDFNGGVIEVLADNDAGGERTITGQQQDGTPVVITIQSAVPAPAGLPADPEAVASSALTNYTTGGPVEETQGFTNEQLAFDESQLRPVFAWAVTPSTVSLTWAQVDGIAGFDIYRDGTLVNTVTTNSFLDSGLTSETQYVYEVKGEGIALDSSSAVPTSERTVPVATLASSLLRASGAGVVPYTYQPYTTAFIYKTFIPDAWVNPDFFAAVGCGLAGQDGYQFKGDNRGYANPGPGAPGIPNDYRSMMFVNVNWDNPAPYDLYLTKGIGSTQLYRYGTLQETRTASMDNMLFQDLQKSGAYAQVRFNHSAGNPFCTAGAITYNVIVRLYRSGTIEVVGSRYPAPNHEGWGRYSNSGGSEAWYNIFQLNNQGFNCLTGACGSETINYNRTV